MKRDKHIFILGNGSCTDEGYKRWLNFRYQLKVGESLSELGATDEDGEPFHPDLVIIDSEPPTAKLFDLVESMRLKSSIPFLVISSLPDPQFMRVCFTAGAQDYLVSPVNEQEVLVKVERIVGISGRSGGPKSKLGRSFPQLDLAKLTISNDQGEAMLTVKEAQIVDALSKSDGWTLTKEDIMEKVWGPQVVEVRTVDVHIFNLRRKLQKLGLKVRFQRPGLYEISPEERAPSPRAESD